MGRLLTWILVLLVLVAGLSFGVLNAGAVPLDYYWGRAEVPLSLALAVAFALGVALGMLGCLSVVVRQRREVARLRKAVRVAEQEVENLRTLPIRDAR